MKLVSNYTRYLVQHLRSTILSGLIIVLPLAATYLVFQFLFDIIDPPISSIVNQLFDREIPGAGIIIFLITLYCAGFIGSYVIGRRIIGIVHNMIDSVPIVRPVYRMTRQTIDALGRSDWGTKYSKVVLLDFPKTGVKSIGLVTAQFKDHAGTDMLAVYIPTSPVPTSGFLALVPEETAINTSLSVDEAMRIVISGGVLMPETVEGESARGCG